MTDRTLYKHLLTALEIKAQLDALKKEYEKERDIILNALRASGLDTFEKSGHKATYTIVNGNKFDRKAFDTDFPGIYKKYSVPNVTTRLDIK